MWSLVFASRPAARWGGRESISSRRLSPELCTFITLRNHGGYREGRVAACTRGRRAKNIARARVTTGTGGDTPAFPAQWVTAYFVLFSVSFALIATVAVASPLEPNDSLTPSLSAPEPHDFIRPRRCRSPHDTGPSTTFRTTSAAIARRPLRGRNGGDYTANQKFWKLEYFCARGLTGFLSACLSGKSVAPHEPSDMRRSRISLRSSGLRFGAIAATASLLPCILASSSALAERPPVMLSCYGLVPQQAARKAAAGVRRGPTKPK